MITTSEIAPTAALMHLIRCYSWREFDTQGADLVRPWYACHELSLLLFFGDVPLRLIDPKTSAVVFRETRSDIVGPGTRYNGEIFFNGRYTIFEIIFRPGGFFRLFRIPSSEITNHIVDAADALGSSISSLLDRLGDTDGLPAKAAVTDAYLLAYLTGRKALPGHDRLSAIPSLLLRQDGEASLRGMASLANMSVRNFERRFIEQVGISPKLFCCVERFNGALSLKLRNPHLDWSAIAHDRGYFDQMHLIKDFKRFAGTSPSDFLHHTPLSREYFTNLMDG